MWFMIYWGYDSSLIYFFYCFIIFYFVSFYFFYFLSSVLSLFLSSSTSLRTSLRFPFYYFLNSVYSFNLFFFYFLFCSLLFLLLLYRPSYLYLLLSLHQPFCPPFSVFLLIIIYFTSSTLFLISRHPSHLSLWTTKSTHVPASGLRKLLRK